MFPLAAFFEFNEFIAYYIQTFKKIEIPTWMKIAEKYSCVCKKKYFFQRTIKPMVQGQKVKKYIVLDRY